MREVVLTCLFTTMPDPLAPLDPGRSEYWPADPHLADTLLASLEGVETVVFHDSLDTDDKRFVKVTPEGPNAYVARWAAYRDWLLANPDVAAAWCVDATDVECLAPDRLFDEVKPGILYVGCEHEAVGCGWMVDNHEASREWIAAHAHEPLLNAGVCGGDRDTMLAFIDLLLGKWREGLAQGLEDKVGDMGYMNRAAREMPEYVTGPRIVTEFKKFERNSWSLWRHK